MKSILAPTCRPIPGAPTRDLSPAQLRTRIGELGDWFHNLELNGIQTAPQHFLGDYPRVKWERFAHALPQDLRGKQVLDIGCNGGFYSIEMKRRGADRVVGIDIDDHYLAQARLAAEVSGVEIELHKLSVYQVDQLGERFDVVLFMGVLYHLRYPLLALDLIRHYAASDLFVFQAMLRGSDARWQGADDYSFAETDVFHEEEFPRLHFIENCYAGDLSNWWIPNLSCAESMLRSAGFTIDNHAEAEVFICRRAEITAEHQLSLLSTARGDHG